MAVKPNHYHYGTFHVHQSWFDGAERIEKLLPLMGKIVVDRCEMMHASRSLAYTAWSRELFEELPEFIPIPQYDILVLLSPMCEVMDVKAVRYVPNPQIDITDPWRSLTYRY